MLVVTGKEFTIITFQYMNNIIMLLKAGLHPGLEYHWLEIYSNSLINVAKRVNITASMFLISTAFQPNLLCSWVECIPGMLHTEVTWFSGVEDCLVHIREALEMLVQDDKSFVDRGNGT